MFKWNNNTFISTKQVILKLHGQKPQGKAFRMAAVSTCKDILRVAFRKFLMNPTDMKNYVLLEINKKTGGKSQLKIVQFKHIISKHKSGNCFMDHFWRIFFIFQILIMLTRKLVLPPWTQILSFCVRYKKLVKRKYLKVNLRWVSSQGTVVGFFLIHFNWTSIKTGSNTLLLINYLG